MTPKFRTNLGVIFMSKLSKQDKIEIYHLWHDYQISPAELSQRYRVGKTNINYLLALIGRHGLAILDQPFTAYTSNFKEQALRRIIVEHEPARRVSIDLGLKSSGMLSNWLREYRKNGYNIVNKQRGRPPHDQKRTADQTGKSSAQARERTLTPAELEAENRERIRKKIERLSRPADQEPQAAEIAQAVTQLRRELKVSVTFILDTINANPNLPHLSRSNYYYSLKKKDKERDNREIKAEIKAIYEEHKHRYGYRRITAELRRRDLLVNHKKVQRLMNKLKLFGIVSKSWHKYTAIAALRVRLSLT